MSTMSEKDRIEITDKLVAEYDTVIKRVMNRLLDTFDAEVEAHDDVTLAVAYMSAAAFAGNIISRVAQPGDIDFIKENFDFLLNRMLDRIKKGTGS